MSYQKEKAKEKEKRLTLFVWFLLPLPSSSPMLSRSSESESIAKEHSSLAPGGQPNPGTEIWVAESCFVTFVLFCWHW